MFSEPREFTPTQIIQREKEAYLENVPESDSNWPPDVRAVYNELQDRLFEMGLEAQEVVGACGIGDHNVYTRFKYFTGHGIKELILAHRLQLAKRLLRYQRIPVGRIALAVGYANPSGFSATFSRREGRSPLEYREQEE